jgi:threonine/homoserine/homoserine lactone efflux protein
MEAAAPELFVRSVLIGLSIAAPVGPIGLLVIQRTLQRGRRIGLATGLGAAVADALYGAVGAYGVHGVIRWLDEARTPLALTGAAVLGWMAWRTWSAPLSDQAADVPAGSGRGLLGAFAGTFVLTLSNPATIFSFMAIFGSMAGSLQGASPMTMVTGVLLGSALWWLVLSAGVTRLRSRFDAHWRRRVNRASAILLAAFALWPLVSLLRD